MGAPGAENLFGGVYSFIKLAGQWRESAETLVDQGASGDYFGLSVAVAGAVGLAGAPFAGGQIGDAYGFNP